jgi:tetraacyldisaccharide 4'-kinase
MSSAPFPIIAAGGRWMEELPGSPWRWLLLPGWCALRPLIALRGALYDRGALPVARLPVPVLAVGNLTAGGTGKTPLVAHLVGWCRARGLACAVLSRGYRGVDGRNDEAELIAGCPVVCDGDRVAGGRAAIAMGARALILDDGFQHRRLHRELDIVVVDATRPWGDPAGGPGALLPLGYLREPRSALARAGIIALSRGEEVAPQALARLRAELAGFRAPLVELREDDPHLRPIDGGERARADSLRGRPVLLVSGIGNPAAFESAAQRHGWQTVASWRFPDHHRYTPAQAERLAGAAARRGAVAVMTAKDAVKLGGLWPHSAPAFVLEVGSRVRAEDQGILDAALERALRAAGTPDVGSA